MNKILSKLLATILVTAMLLGALPAIRAVPPPPEGPLAPTLYLIGPDGTKSTNFWTNNTGVGTTFTVTAWVNTTGVNEGGYAAALLFDNTQLNVTSVAFTANSSSQSHWFYDQGIYAPSTGVPPFMDQVTPPSFSNNPGPTFGIGEPSGFGEIAFFPVIVTPDVNTLFTITFKVIAIPPVGPGNFLTSDVYWDTNVCFIADVNGVADPNASFGNFTYTLTNPPLPPPAEPTFTIQNESSNTFGGPSYDLAHEIGNTFVEDVKILSYDSRLNMINASAEVDYSNITLLTVTTVVFDAAWKNTVENHATPGIVTLYGENNTNIPTGTVAFAVITFQILTQENIPPNPFGYFDKSDLNINANAAVYNSTDLIPNLIDGSLPHEVRVYGYLAQIYPQFLVSSKTMGPDAVVGHTFVINVTLDSGKGNLLVGAEFVLQYNATLIKPISVAEGPFFPYWATLADNDETTQVFAQIDSNLGIWGHNVLFADIILPNWTDSGMWARPFPNDTQVIAEITFQVMYQPPTGTITSPLTILNDPTASFPVCLDDEVSQNLIYPPMQDPVNGLYTITTPAWQVGRMIDLYGGAVNSGHGYLLTGTVNPNVPEGDDWAFPVPYGGQGWNVSMDMVEPQSWVYINAYVSYNGWPVQNKNVAFEISEPDGTYYNKLTAFTDSDGVAILGFRMPWPCDPNTCAALLGKWTVTATVQLADVVINDTMSFKYDFIIHIDSVVTNKADYNHGETVTITINFTSYFMQQFPISMPFPVLIVASIVDNLGVTVGTATYTTTVGGAQWCTYSHYSATLQITIPKWAYAGIATIHVNGFDGIEPVAGGVAITPEYVGPTILIMPA